MEIGKILKSRSVLLDKFTKHVSWSNCPELYRYLTDSKIPEGYLFQAKALMNTEQDVGPGDLKHVKGGPRCKLRFPEEDEIFPWEERDLVNIGPMIHVTGIKE